MAPITALSVQRPSGATCNRTPRRWDSSSSRARRGVRRYSTAHAQGLQSRPFQREHRLADQAVGYRLLKAGRQVGDLLRRKAKLLEIGPPRTGDRVADGGFQSAEAEIEPLLIPQERPREGIGAAISARGGALDGRAARITQAEHAGHLVERLTGGIVNRRAEEPEVQRGAAAIQVAVPAADDRTAQGNTSSPPANRQA